MKRSKKLSILTITLISCFFAEIAINVACGPEEDPYDYHLSFFHNNIQGGKAYSAFYYTNYPFLYDDSEPEDEQTVNVKEWTAYFGSHVKSADVEQTLYHLDLASELVPNKKHLQSRAQLPDSLKNNSCLKAITSAKNKPALKYYLFAQSVERIGSAEELWETKGKDLSPLIRAGEKALAGSLAEKDQFIKLRYLFQAVKLFRYGNQYQKAVDVYNKYVQNYKGTSHAKGWALAVKAGAERKLGDTVLAAYHFSQVFARYPERRIQAYKNYLYIGVKESDVIELAKSKKEQAYIYAIEAFNKPDLNLQALKRVYSCYPASDMVGVLLIREINKLEEYYLTPKLSSSLPDKPWRIFDEPLTKSSAKTYQTTIQNLERFCATLYTERKYSSPALGKLAIAYLDWMQNLTQQGFNALKTIENEKLSEAMTDQKHLISLLLTSQSIKQLNTANQQEQLLGDLKWLDKKIAEERKAGKALANDDYWSANSLGRFAMSARDFASLC